MGGFYGSGYGVVKNVDYEGEQEDEKEESEEEEKEYVDEVPIDIENYTE
jgi:hypothetical protein